MYDRDSMKAALIDRLREALIRQVGDTRECPCCGNAFIPKDETTLKALEVYKELFGIDEGGS